MKTITKQGNKSSGFLTIPRYIEDKIVRKIKPLTEREVFRFVLRYTWGWYERDSVYMSYKWIMDETGIESERTINNAFKGLEQKGLIHKRRTGHYNKITLLLSVGLYMRSVKSTEPNLQKVQNGSVKNTDNIYNHQIEKHHIELNAQKNKDEPHTQQAQNFLKWKENLTKSKEWNKYN